MTDPLEAEMAGVYVRRRSKPGAPGAAFDEVVPLTMDLVLEIMRYSRNKYLMRKTVRILKAGQSIEFRHRTYEPT